MCRAQPGVGQAHSRQVGSQRHLRTRRIVPPVGTGRRQAARRLQSAQRERVGDRLCPVAGICFNQLGQRIHAAPRHQVRRQIAQQFRIDQCHRRQQARVTQAFFEAPLRGSDDGIFRRLGAGARGGRYRQQRQWIGVQRATRAHAFQILADRIDGRLRRQRRYRLAQINHAAAADRHHHLRACLACDRGGGIHVSRLRFARLRRQFDHRQSRVAQQLPQSRSQPRARERFAAARQRHRRPEAPRLRRQLG